MCTQTAGEFTQMRSALVNNLHLGTLLTRRFGIDRTLRFFDASPREAGLGGKAAQLRAIHDFIEEVPANSTPPTVVEALETMARTAGQESKAKVREGVEAGISIEEAEALAAERSEAKPYSRRGEDYRKPVGDQYEAIVGLIFIALNGNMDATWRFFEPDFFPAESGEKASDDDGETAEARRHRALQRVRRENAKIEIQCAIAAGGASDDALRLEARSSPRCESVADAKRMRDETDQGEQRTTKRCNHESCVCETKVGGEDLVLDETKVGGEDLVLDASDMLEGTGTRTEASAPSGSNDLVRPALTLVSPGVQELDLRALGHADRSETNALVRAMYCDESLCFKRHWQAYDEKGSGRLVESIQSWMQLLHFGSLANMRLFGTSSEGNNCGFRSGMTALKSVLTAEDASLPYINMLSGEASALRTWMREAIATQPRFDSLQKIELHDEYQLSLEEIFRLFTAFFPELAKRAGLGFLQYHGAMEHQEIRARIAHDKGEEGGNEYDCHTPIGWLAQKPGDLDWQHVQLGSELAKVSQHSRCSWLTMTSGHIVLLLYEPKLALPQRSMGGGSESASVPLQLPPVVAPPPLQQNRNPVSAVLHILQERRIQLAAFLQPPQYPESKYPELKYGCLLTHVGGELLGEAKAIHPKKEKGVNNAKAAAYANMYGNPRFHDLVSKAPPGQGGVPGGGGHGGGGGGCNGGSSRGGGGGGDSGRDSGGNGGSEPQQLQQSQQAGSMAGSKRALTTDIASLVSFALGSERWHRESSTPTAAPTEDEIDAILDTLGEEEAAFRRRIRGFILATDLPVTVLQALVKHSLTLARRVRPRPPERSPPHTAARLFHDTLCAKVQRDTTYEPPLTPEVGDVVRIFGLKAAEHNGSTGVVTSWVANKDRFGVKTAAKPGGIEVLPCKLQLLRLGAAHRERFHPIASQMMHYLLDAAEEVAWDQAMITAHGLELPLYLFNTFHKLREDVLDGAMGLPTAPRPRFDALQQAVQSAPMLSLCGAFDDRVRRQSDLECSPFDGTPIASVIGDTHVVRPAPGPGGTFDAMLFPGGAEPSIVQVALRVDYLNALTERLIQLNGGVGAPLGLHGRYAGQTTEQPVLYFLLLVSPPPAAHNAVASLLAGFDIYGPAILADVALASAMPPELQVGGISSCERYVAMASADPVSYMLGDARRPLLGGWGVPRLEAWPATFVRDSSWSKRPIALLEDWLLRQPQALFVESQGRAARTDAQGNDEPNTPFIGHVRTNAWTLGLCTRDPPPGVDLHVDDGFHLLVGLRHHARKKDAQHEAVLCLMRALADDAPVPPFHIVSALELPEEVATAADAESDGAAGAATAGTTVTCSYILCMASSGRVASGAGAAGAAAGEPEAAHVAVGSARRSTLEEQHRIEVLLGAGVLNSKVEGLLADAANVWLAWSKRIMGPVAEGPRSAESLAVEFAVPMQARYRGVDVQCDLELTVHSVALSVEETGYELTGGDVHGGTSLGELRLQKLVDLVNEFQPASLADIGCGEGKLLRRLLAGSAPLLRRMVGVDVDSRALGCGARKLAATRVSHVDGAQGSAIAVRLLLSRREAAFADLDPAQLGPVDVMTLVEVVEHLDPPELRELGAALLGRCAPRVLLVTTPNKEYNLNMMVRCARQPTCQYRGATCNTEKIKQLEREGDICPNCALFLSGVRPPLHSYGKRCRDHRFEWTRHELQEWATGLGAEFGYDVQFDGVGGGAFDERDLYAEAHDQKQAFHGPGPSSQIAIFVRREQCEEGRAPPGAVQMAVCVWNSEAEL